MVILEKEWESFNKHQLLTRVISAIMPEKSEELINQTYYELKDQDQREPGIVEILWEINTRMEQECLKKGQFEKFRYHTLFYADILTYDSRDREALPYLFQVIYLDLNGVSNTKNIKGRSAYTERAVKVSVDLVGEARTVKNKLNLSMDEVKAEFCSSVDRISVIIPSKPLVSAEEGWQQISRIIE
jgi:hypothetical protein